MCLKPPRLNRRIQIRIDARSGVLASIKAAGSGFSAGSESGYRDSAAGRIVRELLGLMW
jgi:hypothetical protein